MWTRCWEAVPKDRPSMVDILRLIDSSIKPSQTRDNNIPSRGPKIISGSADNTINIWNAESGQQSYFVIPCPGPVVAIAFSPDRTMIVTGLGDSTVRIWDARSGEELKRFDGHSKAVLSVAFSPDGATIASASSGKTVSLWDAKAGNRSRILNGHTEF